MQGTDIPVQELHPFVHAAQASTCYSMYTLNVPLLELERPINVVSLLLRWGSYTSEVYNIS